MRAVADICRRLGGLPLAVELAAARTGTCCRRRSLARLDDPLPLLTGGPTDAPERHRTLRRTIAWSHGLLDREAAVVFGRASVFAGSFGLEAAHEVGGLGIATTDADTLELLAELVDHSLLGRAPPLDTEPRFVMHDVIREFAGEVIDDEPAARRRHLASCLRLARRLTRRLTDRSRRAGPRRSRPTSTTSVARLAGPNGPAQRRSRSGLAAALGSFWRWHGDLREGIDWLERALSASGSERLPVRNKAERRAARILALLGERERALTVYESARRSAEADGDAAGVADALVGIGMLNVEASRPEVAVVAIDEALAVATQSGDPTAMETALSAQANLSHFLGKPAEARGLYEEILRLARSNGNSRTAAVALVNLADIHILERDYAGAVPLLREGIEYLDQIGDVAFSPWASLVLGLALRQLGNLHGARSALERGSRLAVAGAVAEDDVLALETIADWLGAAGAHHDALMAWAAAAHAREQRDLPMLPTDHLWVDPGVERDRTALTPATARTAWQAGISQGLGRALPEAQQALGAVVLTGARSRADSSDLVGLTPREREVLELLVGGRFGRRDRRTSS